MFRHRHLIYAVLLALVATLLTASYIRRLERQITGEVSHKDAFIAAVPIAKGAVVKEDMVTRCSLPAGIVPADAITSEQDVVGKVARVDMVAGEILLASRFSEQSEQGLEWQLEPGWRAITVSVQGLGVLAKEIEAGTCVDVIGVLPDMQTGVEHSLLVLQGVRVLGVAADVNDGYQGFDRSEVVLAVTPRQAQKLALFQSTGSLRLLLRPAGLEKAALTPPPITPDDVLGNTRHEMAGIKRNLGLLPPADGVSDQDSGQESIKEVKENSQPEGRDAAATPEVVVEIIRGTTSDIFTVPVPGNKQQEKEK